MSMGCERTGGMDAHERERSASSRPADVKPPGRGLRVCLVKQNSTYDLYTTTGPALASIETSSNWRSGALGRWKRSNAISASCTRASGRLRPHG
jgi:hypothetical protein